MKKPLVMSRKQLVQREKYHREKHAEYKSAFELQRKISEEYSISRSKLGERLHRTQKAHLETLEEYGDFLEWNRKNWRKAAILSGVLLFASLAQFIFIL